MTDQDDEQQNNLFEEPEEPAAQERREFLRSLGKWSQAVIGGVVLGGAVTTSPQAQANWYNRGGGWHNRGGGWFNRGGGGWANIPPRSNRRDPICFSPWLYRQRNLVERFFNRIKHFRGIATRYDKCPENYLAAVKLICARIWCAA